MLLVEPQRLRSTATRTTSSGRRRRGVEDDNKKDGAVEVDCNEKVGSSGTSKTASPEMLEQQTGTCETAAPQKSQQQRRPSLSYMAYRESLLKMKQKHGENKSTPVIKQHQQEDGDRQQHSKSNKLAKIGDGSGVGVIVKTSVKEKKETRKAGNPIPLCVVVPQNSQSYRASLTGSKRRAGSTFDRAMVKYIQEPGVTGRGGRERGGAKNFRRAPDASTPFALQETGTKTIKETRRVSSDRNDIVVGELSALLEKWNDSPRYERADMSPPMSSILGAAEATELDIEEDKASEPTTSEKASATTTSTFSSTTINGSGTSDGGDGYGCDELHTAYEAVDRDGMDGSIAKVQRRKSSRRPLTTSYMKYRQAMLRNASRAKAATTPPDQMAGGNGIASSGKNDEAIPEAIPVSNELVSVAKDEVDDQSIDRCSLDPTSTQRSIVSTTWQAAEALQYIEVVAASTYDDEEYGDDEEESSVETAAGADQANVEGKQNAEQLDYSTSVSARSRKSTEEVVLDCEPPHENGVPRTIQMPEPVSNAHKHYNGSMERNGDGDECSFCQLNALDSSVAGCSTSSGTSTFADDYYFNKQERQISWTVHEVNEVDGGWLARAVCTDLNLTSLLDCQSLAQGRSLSTNGSWIATCNVEDGNGSDE